MLHLYVFGALWLCFFVGAILFGYLDLSQRIKGIMSNTVTSRLDEKTQQKLHNLRRHFAYAKCRIYISSDMGNNACSCRIMGTRGFISIGQKLFQEEDESLLWGITAHEVGHYTYQHQLQRLIFNTFLGSFFAAVMTSLLFLTCTLTYDAIMLNGQYIWPLLAMGTLYLIMFRGKTANIMWHFCLEKPISKLCHWHEFQADAYASRKGYGESMIRVLSKPQVRSEESPNHPSTKERIKRLKSLNP